MVKRGTSKRDRKRKDANSCKQKSSKTSALPSAAAAAAANKALGNATGAGHQGPAARAAGPQLLDAAVFKSVASKELE